MANGRILRGIGGFYYILPEHGQDVVECKARGKLRSEKMTPMVGDLVTYEPQENGQAALESILPRKNLLIRPPVSNIDQLLIVLSASVPEPDWLLADKLIIQAKMAGIAPFMVLNKCDEQKADIVSSFLADYGQHFPCLCVSAETGENIDVLKDILKGRVSCFSGQSAVGKSSLINAILPGLELETGSLSKKTDRGKHTTRRAELWPAFGGAVLDTPGFSLFDPELIEQENLDRCYPEFGKLPSECQFAGCMHISEPGCAVKNMVKSGGMTASRYDRYRLLAKEFETRRKHRYD